MSLYQEPTLPLDLTPKIEENDLLLPYNPLDYPRLLGWILYDPPKLDAYVNRAKAATTEQDEEADGWQFAYEGLLWQVMILFVIEMAIFLVIYWQFSTLTEPEKWANILLGMLLAGGQVFALMMVREHWSQAIGAIPVYVALGCMCIILLMDHAVQPRLLSYWIACSAFGAFCGIVLHTLSASKDSLLYNLEDQVVMGLIITLFSGVILVFQHEDLRAALGNIGGIVAFLFTITRFDDWLRSGLSMLGSGQRLADRDALSLLANKIPRVTPLSFPWLSILLETQLKEHWANGLQSALALRDYTQQRSLTDRIMRGVLRGAPEAAIVPRVADLDQDSRWSLAKLTPPAPSGERGTFRTFRQSLFQSQPRQERRYRQNKPIISPKPIHPNLPQGTPTHAAIAGFRYLRANRPQLAQRAFARVPGAPLGVEMANIAETLHLLNTSKNLSDAETELPPLPPRPQRNGTWSILQNLHDVIRLAWVFRCCQHQAHRDRVRAIMLDKLQTIEELAGQKPISSLAEAAMLRQVGSEWQKNVTSMGGTRATSPAMKPAPIPFIYAEPLRTSHVFVGRFQQLDKLQRAWLNDQLPLILIYGSRQTGKTSLLYNSIAHNIASPMDPTARLVHVSLQQVERKTTRAQLLDIMGDAVDDVAGWRSPSYQKLRQNPYQAFALYIRTICRELLPDRLVIVLDEFEQLNSVITEPAKRQDLARYFQSLAQTEPNLHFVFVTTYTPDDIERQYQRPFATNLYSVAVDFLTETEARQLLRYPVQSFLPYCDDSTIARIMTLTAGQPYLVQLIGFHLLQYYNDQLNRRPVVDPFFTAETVNAILYSPDFCQQSNYYFQNLLDEAEQTNVACVELLQRLASPACRTTRTDRPALRQLEAHGIIWRKDQSWAVRIPLFAEWLVGRMRSQE